MVNGIKLETVLEMHPLGHSTGSERVGGQGWEGSPFPPGCCRGLEVSFPNAKLCMYDGV